jgi:hypothetical protein
MLGPVTMDLEDYDRACECVNACEGINPEAVPHLLRVVRQFCQDVQEDGPDFINESWPDLYETFEDAQAALAKARNT